MNMFYVIFHSFGSGIGKSVCLLWNIRYEIWFVSCRGVRGCSVNRCSVCCKCWALCLNCDACGLKVKTERDAHAVSQLLPNH